MSHLPRGCRAQLIRLQTVGDAQDFSGLRATFRLFTATLLDDVVRIDDESRAQSYAFLGITHAQLID